MSDRQTHRRQNMLRIAFFTLAVGAASVMIWEKSTLAWKECQRRKIIRNSITFTNSGPKTILYYGTKKYKDYQRTHTMFIGDEDSPYKIMISMTNGHVTWAEKAPNESGRLFWDCVVLAYPQVKAEIIAEHEMMKKIKIQ